MRLNLKKNIYRYSILVKFTIQANIVICYICFDSSVGQSIRLLTGRSQVRSLFEA